MKFYLYEGARYDKSSGFGQGYDVIVWLMETADFFEYHLFNNNLFVTENAADLLLQKRTFITGTMYYNQLKHLPKENVNATSNVGQKIYYWKDNLVVMSNK